MRYTEKDKENIIKLISYGIRFGFPQEMKKEDWKEFELALHSAKKVYKNFGYKTDLIDNELESIKKHRS